MTEQRAIEPTASAENPPTPAPTDVPPTEIHLPPGVSQVRMLIESPENTRVEIDVEARTPAGLPLGSQSLVFGEALLPHAPMRISRVGAWTGARAASITALLFALALAVYAFTRLYDLPSFPVYFFTDEAVQTVTATDLLRDNFHGPTGELLPAYFENGSQYNLSASVYLQVLPYILFGKSVWVTRGISALMTLLAAASVGLILKRVFKSPYPWLAVLFLAVTPAWFLHSRTAFETALATTFYAAFLYFYLLYRTENPRSLYLAVIFGGLAWYSYSGLRMVMVVTCLLLLLSDLKFHWVNRAVLLRGLGLAFLLFLPFVRFLINHPDASQWQMRLLGSYWIADLPLIEKLGNYAIEYLRGLNPLYWYLPNDWDLSRHLLRGYGHLLRSTLPLGLLGLALAVRNFRSPGYRVLLIAVLAAPTGAALVRLGITRALVMVIPMAILTALGAEYLIRWAQRRWSFTRPLLPLLVFLLLSGGSLYMLRDALVNGPLWFSDYGLTGLQYGSRQVFTEIRDYLDQRPGTRLILSPSWANGTDVIARFFFDDPLPFEMGSVVGYFDEVRPLDDKTLFVMIPEELVKIPPSRFTNIQVEKTLLYPDGRPGFFFVRMQYVPDIEKVMAREEAQRRQPKTERLILSGQPVDLSYTPLDMGQVTELFDGSRDSLVRTYAINPMLLTFDFFNPVPMNAVIAHVGGTATTFHLKVWHDGLESPAEINHNAPEDPRPRDVALDFPARWNVTRIEMEIKNTNDPPDGHVHVWEVIFK